MAFTSTSTTTPSPRHDDVLTLGDVRSGRWEVGVASTEPSVSYAPREGATAIARKFSKVHHVDVWVSNGPSLECVASNRRHTKPEDDAKRSTPLAGMFSNQTT